MEPLFEHRLSVDGCETRALELEGDGPGLVLLHGWGDSADTWRPLLSELGRRDRRALAVDLPGFGRASRLDQGAILPQLDAFAGALVQEWAQDGEVVVVGNSLGGVTALRLAERADLPLAGVVPVAPAGLEMPRWFEFVERDPLVRRLLALPLPIASPILRALVGEAYRRLVFAKPRAAEASSCLPIHGTSSRRGRPARQKAWSSGAVTTPWASHSTPTWRRASCPAARSSAPRETTCSSISRS